MKYIQLLQKDNDLDWSMQFMDKRHYDVCYDEDVFIRKPDGSPLMVLLKNVIPEDINATAWSVLRKWNQVSSNRGVASGIKSRARKKLDGTMSKTAEVPLGWEVKSGIVGNFERTVRTPLCHPCAWNDHHPEKMAKLHDLVVKVSEIYKQWVPERWQVQYDLCQKIDPAWVIADSVFTTLTINKNFRTSCHKDAGDLPEGFSCLSVIREGRYLGGELVFPNYRAAAELRTGDLILFDPHEFHGNCQIVPLKPKTQRCSIVYYFREMMQFCKSPAEELEYAKNRKLGDTLWPELK